MDDFMIEIIPHDFEVDLLQNQEEVCLFCRVKTGYLHFVKYYENRIIQYHIPRVTLAKFLDRLFNSDTGSSGTPLGIALEPGFLLRKYADNRIGIELGNHSFAFDEGADKPFYDLLKKEAADYKKAAERVKWDKQTCFLEKIRTVKGKKLESREGNAELLTAIAFEQLTIKPRVSKHSISFLELYSLYLEGDHAIPADWTDEMARLLVFREEEGLNNELEAIYAQLVRQKYLVPFADDEAVELENYSDSIGFALKELPPLQKVQFKFLFGLFEHPFILPLAWVRGLIDTYDYKEFVLGGSQPDSEEEQMVSYTMALIRDFGQCMQEGMTQSQYPSVTIGLQTWMAENLDVDHFRNGDSIPRVDNGEEWAKAKEEEQPAWCYYEFDEDKGKTFGKLYNSFAVHDPRGLAPEGWRIPGLADWTILTDFLGEEAGTRLKDQDAWDESLDKDKDCGFHARPGGLYGTYSFNQEGEAAYFWTSQRFSQGDTPNAVYCCVVKEKEEIVKGRYFTWCFMGVRCIR